MKNTFRSKVDGKLWMVGCATPCAALVAIGTSAAHREGALRLLALVMTLAAVIVVWTVLSTYYEFTGGILVAHSGPFSWRIPLKEICGVRESRSARSGPALSMDRLEIAWGNGRVMLLSPQDKMGFIETLHRLAPQLGSTTPGSSIPVDV